MLGAMRASNITRLIEGTGSEPTAASAIIIRALDTRVFIARRSLDKPAWPGLWETIGGGIEPGETPVSCLLREIKEELHVGVKQFCFFRDYEFYQSVVRVFIVELAAEPVPDTADFIEWGWFAKDEIRRMDFAADCKKRLKDFFALPEYQESLRTLE